MTTAASIADPTPGRRVLPAVVAAMAGAWCMLAPWRPVLAGDDFGYYDSVVQSLVRGGVVVSDWLNPFSVGLVAPAAGLVSATGDLWLGSMLTVGLFGLTGLVAVGLLLRRVGCPVPATAAGMLVWAFFPAWMAKWTHFESAVPAASLMLVALVCFLQARQGRSRRSWLMLLAGGAGAAWAVSIRQNHVVLVFVGGMAILVDADERKALHFCSWTLLPLLAFAILQFGMPRTYAQEHMVAWNLAQLHPGELGGRLLRSLFQSVGCAAGLALLTDPSGAVRRLAPLRDWRWAAGAGSVTLMVVLALASGDAGRWLAPRSDVLYLERFPAVLATVTLAGGLLWPFGVQAGPVRWESVGLLACAAGYLCLASLWGYWDYYLLEPVLLIWLSIAGLANADPRWPAGAMARTCQVLIIAGYIATSGYGQRAMLDLQSQQVRAVEQSFRDGLASPAECDGVPFGLLGWNLFPVRANEWEATRTGNPLAFWQDRTVYRHFRWRKSAAAVGSPHGRVLREGLVRVGFRSIGWSLTESGGTRDTRTAAPHRPLPLTREEWRQYRRGERFAP